MNKHVCRVGRVFFWAHSKISVFVEIPLLNIVDWGEESITSDIKFPSIDEQRSFYVSLNDVCPFLFVFHFVFNRMVLIWVRSPCQDSSSNFLKSVADNNAIASIGIFSWFYDVHVFRVWYFIFITVCWLETFIRPSLLKSFGLSFFNSSIIFFNSCWFCIFQFLKFFFHFVIVFHKQFELRVICSMVDMKSNWESVPRVLSFWLIILRYVPKQGFLVTQMKVVLESIVYFGFEKIDAIFFLFFIFFLRMIKLFLLDFFW